MIVFIVSTVVHLVLVYVYHRFNLRDRILPKSSEKNNTIQPVLKVPNDCSKELSRKLYKRYHLLAPDAIEKSHLLQPVPHKNINSEPKPQAATSFSPAALIPTDEIRMHIAGTAIVPPQEKPCASIGKNPETLTCSV